SATAPDSHGISCADPLFQARKELDRELAPWARRFKIYLKPSHKPAAKCDNGAVGRQHFFLLSQSLKNCVALLCRRDRVGDIPKIICRVFSNDTGRTPFQVASRFRRLCAIQLHDFLATPSTFPFLITPCSETRHPPLTNQLL